MVGAAECAERLEIIIIIIIIMIMIIMILIIIRRERSEDTACQRGSLSKDLSF